MNLWQALRPCWSPASITAPQLVISLQLLLFCVQCAADVCPPFDPEESKSNQAASGTNASSCGLTSWQLQETFAGSTFFDAWEFIERWDNATRGATYYVDKQTAHELQLAYIDQNSRAIIAIDSKTDLSSSSMPAIVINQTDGTCQVNPDGLRKSVRLESLKRYEAGTLVIADFYHVPYGCASWGAFWMFGNKWPDLGELDIYEGWNDQAKNYVSLHTSPNCSHDPAGIQLGKVKQETCDTQVNFNAGCGIEDPSTDSYGAQFNNGNGGVFAALYTNTVVAVWRWSRSGIPKDVLADTLKPSTWGPPVATWLNGPSCEIDSHMGPQNLAFTLVTCGDADRESWKTSKCQGSSCFDVMIKGSNYEQAYFSVNSIKVFTGNPTYSYLTHHGRNLGSHSRVPKSLFGLSTVVLLFYFCWQLLP